MIDIQKVKDEFKKYALTYDLNNDKIKLKYKHILEVAKNCRAIAENLNLTNEQIDLAEVIGIFHDIGRFEQAKLYDTFSDKDTGLDHAAYGLKILYDDGMVSRFLDTNEYDDIIKKAVFNHNKANISDEVKGEALIFSKIIRDADKLDIFRVMVESSMKDIFWYKEFENLSMSDSLMEKFKKEHFIKYNEITNNADLIYVFYGYVFDFNYDAALEIIKEGKYLDKFAVRIEETFKSESINKKTKELLKITNEFLMNK